MKKLFLTSIATSALLLGVTQSIAAEHYTLDPTHTNITWKTNHFGFSNPSGKFTKAEGVFILDETQPEKSSVDITIYPGSVMTGIEKFDDHLISADFFNAIEHEQATFKSTSIEMTGENTAKIHGNLTLLGVSKPVTLDTKLNKVGVNPINKLKTAGFSATTTIKRSEFGMSWGVPNVGDDVLIEIEVEGNTGSTE